MEGVFNPRFGLGDDATFVFLVTILVAIRFHLVHARAGKHSFGARDRAAVRADVDRADRARRFISERDDPNGIAALIRARLYADEHRARGQGGARHRRRRRDR